MNAFLKPGGPVDYGRLLYPVNDAAYVLGLGRSRTWELIREGVLETTKIGGRTLVRADSLIRVAEQGA